MPLVMGLAQPAYRAIGPGRHRATSAPAATPSPPGDVGYRYLLRALADGGRSDVIFDVNNQSEKPGYGCQLRKGATSLTEAWDAGRASSQNHFMLGQIMEWFYHDLAGIGLRPRRSGLQEDSSSNRRWSKMCTWAKASLPVDARATSSVPGRRGESGCT